MTYRKAAVTMYLRLTQIHRNTTEGKRYINTDFFNFAHYVLLIIIMKLKNVDAIAEINHRFQSSIHNIMLELTVFILFLYAFLHD